MYYTKFCLSDSLLNYTKLLAKRTLRCNHPYIAIYITYMYVKPSLHVIQLRESLCVQNTT